MVLALLLGPALFAGRSFLPLDNLRGHAPFRDRAPTEPHGNALRGDLLTLIAPLQQQVRNAWAEGRWPLWNGAAGAGMPLLANPQAQVGQPLAVAALPFGVDRGAAISAALRILCALLFGWLFFRRLGLGESAAAFGGISYALGGFVGLWLGWPLGNAAALLPLGLYAICGVYERGSRGDVALCLGALVAILLGGQPESVLYALLTLLLFALVRLRHVAPGSRRSAMRRLAAAGALALALAAPLLGPAMELLPRTLRAADRSLTDDVVEAPGWRQTARLRWLQAVAPNAFGNGRYGDPSGAVYWGATNFNEDASGFAGTLALLAATASLGARRRFAHERFAWLLLALALFALAPPPVVGGWLARLPLWQLSANGHHRLLMLVSWSLAWLGACGVERAVRGQLSWQRLALAGGALAGLLLWATLGHSHPEHPEALAVLRIGWLKLQLKLLVAGALLLWAAARVRATAVGLAGLAAAELLVLQVAANPLAPRESFPPPSLALAFVAEQGSGGRLAALDDALPANLAGLWGLRDARLYDPATPASYARLVRPLNGPAAAPHEFRADDHALYDSLAVRYLLAAPERAVPGDAILLYAEPDAWVWERPRAPDLVTLLPHQAGDAQRLAWRQLGPQRLQLASALEAPRFLGVSILGEAGWRLLDERSIVRTRGPLIAAPLDSGRHRLELIYRPAIFLRGLALAALAAAGALAWLLPPPRRQVTIARPPRIDAGFGPPIRLGAQPGFGRTIDR